jgi:signal transduction histidine kinase
MNQRGRLVSGVLLAVWVMILAWQIVEHQRVRHSAQAALINRAKDVSTTLGIVLRSQRRFGVISKERLETALNDLLKQEELKGVTMLNATGGVVALAGVPIDLELKGLVPTGEHWGAATVTLMNLVDLGMNVTSDFENTNPPIVLPPRDRSLTNRPPPPPREGELDRERNRDRDRPEGQGEPPRGGPNPALANFGPDPGGEANPNPPPPGRPRGRRGGGDGRPPFGRPFWMSEEEYKEAIQKQGIHSFVLVLSTAGMHSTLARDRWTRLFICVLATVSVLGLGVAWRNLARTSELEVRLVRASQLNLHLKEMNLAAAGLAHETRNPLNIIRGLAQMVSKRDDVSPEIRNKSLQIVDESDRVSAQLNEFINYSRPREVRRSAVALGAVVSEVVRALSGDLEEKKIRLHTARTQLTVEADEQMLRQALFNLLLNATQAVAVGGEIQIGAARDGSEATLEVGDNGPGVPPERRSEIFKPYFTTHEKGTGLGLAVVQQIVLAHGWEIVCLPNQPRGALFRITHLKLAAGNG